MKIFGGFGGKHLRIRDAEPASPEAEELSAAGTDDIEEQEVSEGPIRETEETTPEEGSGEMKRSPEEQAEIDEMIRRYQRKKHIRRWIIIGVIAAILAAGFIVYKTTVKPPKIVQPSPPPATAAPTAPVEPSSTPTSDPGGEEPEPTPTAEPTPAVRERMENIYNILILGRDQGNGNTDTIMICQFNAEAGEVNVLSIPRDTCANVESNPDNNELKKISGIYSRAQVEGVMAAAGDIIGAPMDGYAMVNLNGFIQLVETIGGVDYNIPYYMNYDDPTQNLHIHFNTGMQHLGGYDAVKVVRWRQNNDGTNYGDIARIQVQQGFLTAVAKKCLSLSSLASNLGDYVKIFEQNVSTDLTNGNLVWFGQQFLNMGMENIHFYTLPTKENDSIKGWSYCTILVDEWMEMLNAHFNVYNMPMEAEDVDIISRDANGNLYATSGVIKGGESSFLDYQVWLRRFNAWQEAQRPQSQESSAGSAEPAESNDPAPTEQESAAESAPEPAPETGGETNSDTEA